MLIDGSSLMFRAFYGLPVTAFKAPNGQPINAVRGFLDMLARLVGDRKPRAIVVATDEDWRPAFRVDVIPSYKTARLERGAMPAELEPQEPIIRQVLAATGVEVLGAEGFEAEDVIAVLRGDPSDGLPGVPGVGEKTAAQLVRRYKNLDGIIASGKLGDAANAYIQQARRVGIPVGIAPLTTPQGTRPKEPRDPKALAR